CPDGDSHPAVDVLSAGRRAARHDRGSRLSHLRLPELPVPSAGPALVSLRSVRNRGGRGAGALPLVAHPRGERRAMGGAGPFLVTGLDLLIEAPRITRRGRSRARGHRRSKSETTCPRRGSSPCEALTFIR